MAKESVELDPKKSSANEAKSKSYYKKSKRQEVNTFPTKVLIRGLPPSMTKESFVEEVSPLPEHNYLWFVAADPGLGQFAFSRAYINFCNQEDIFIFTEKFDGYVFVDKKGDEYCAIVEFAPFQKIPKAAKKKDAKCGTIETDPDFLQFLENLESQAAAKIPSSTTAETIEEITAKERELKANKGVLKTSTPLLDYLRKKKEDRIRIREEKKEERKKKEAEKRKQREDEKRKHIKDKDHKGHGEKPAKSKESPKVLLGKHSAAEKKINEEELTSNLKTLLKISDSQKSAVHTDEAASKDTAKEPVKEGKPEAKDVKKREFKKKEKRAVNPEQKKERPENPEKKFQQKPKPAPAPAQKESKSYKEERQRLQEARAARAAAKHEEKKSGGEKEDGNGESSGGKPATRVRNKDRPALQIYRPGMLKNRSSKDSDSKGEQAGDIKERDDSV